MACCLVAGYWKSTGVVDSRKATEPILTQSPDPKRDEAVTPAGGIAPAFLSAAVVGEQGSPATEVEARTFKVTGLPPNADSGLDVTVTLKTDEGRAIDPAEYEFERTTPPRLPVAMGTASGDSFTATLPSSGKYTVRRLGQATPDQLVIQVAPIRTVRKPRIAGFQEKIQGPALYQTRLPIPGGGEFRNNPAAILSVIVTGHGGRQLVVLDDADDVLGSLPAEDPATAPAEVVIPLDANAGGRRRIRVVDAWDLTSGDGTGVRVLLQDPRGVTARPTVRRASQNLFIEPVGPISGSDPIESVDGYLRLAGATGSAETLKFAVFNPTGDQDVFIRRADDARARTWRRSSKGDWDVDLDFDAGAPQPDQVTSHLFAIDERPDGQAFSLAVPVERTALGDPDRVPPTLSSVEPEPTSSAGSDGGTADPRHIFTASKRVKIAGAGVPEAAVQAGAVVAVFHQDSQVPIGVTAPEDDGTWTLTTGDLPEGDFLLRAEIIQGATRSDFQRTPRTDATKPYQLSIRRSGPVIQEYVPYDFGVVAGEQTLTIRFRGNKLLKSAVEEPTNYSISLAGAGGKYAPVDPSKYTVSYEEPTNSILIKISDLIAGNYRVELTASVAALRDVYGNPIQGVQGDSERGLIRMFERTAGGGAGGTSRDRLAALELAPIPPARQAPFVAYPEFVSPRDPTNGFNPSDKVETRVVRLYYNRDAHRVAQIVNRHVESYNRVAVDTRRRLATETRREADRLTDTRRIQEMTAIKAAEEARAAERELEQAQQALGTIQARGAQAVGRIPRLRADLTAAQNELTAAKAADPVGTAERTLQAQAQVDGLNIALEKATRDETESVDGLSGAQDRVTAARNLVQSRREAEAAARIESAREGFDEDRAREQQFRLEVAAAHEDPDTFAPGNPRSIDPVEQVSVAVVGEALIQLRGPMKGVNIVRKMINELDGPAGQVRIAIHTVQINGEHGDRMEKVASRIKDYIDHSRFLTMQSGQYLRNAVVKVAARRAVEAAAECPEGASQETRDQKYIAAFFGEDFLRELIEIDSEFLKSGNKVLSLHSMDSTSLASALFLMALAKNETRVEILDEFRASLAAELPAAEMNYYEAGGDRDPKKKHAHPHKKNDDFVFLANNARFQSLIGYFDHQLDGNDTLNPIQREFIRLAQIFKSRLVTEMQFNQRVKERAIIEERLGNRLEELQKQKDRQEAAEKALATQLEALNQQRTRILAAFAPLSAQIAGIQNRIGESQELYAQLENIRILANVDDARRIRADVNNQVARYRAASPDASSSRTILRDLEKALEQYKSVVKKSESNINIPEMKDLMSQDGFLNAPDQKNDQPSEEFTVSVGRAKVRFHFVGDLLELEPVGEVDGDQVLAEVGVMFGKWVDLAGNMNDALFSEFALDPSMNARVKSQVETLRKLREVRPGEKLNFTHFSQLHALLFAYRPVLEHIQAEMQGFIAKFNTLNANLGDSEVDPKALHREVQLIRAIVENWVQGSLRATSDVIFNEIELSFRPLMEANLRRQFADKALREARSAFDHKKLLEMHIDDMEDKYIELLEGTRSHIAVMDGFIKALATALDDDFNTQYYDPAFRRIREASRFWDVQLAQIEKTSVLTNNRGFGKVDPTATMEFDLPKRDILITEAMNGAKALVDEYGALLNDPTFLSLTKLRSGQPTSSLAQGTLGGGASAVRSVLPELSRNDDEEVLRQAGPGRREFGSALEALIPDPAVYKFETGTGYEVRPVLQPDGQAVTFDFNYMYTTNVREPVRADEKHLGRVKRHFIHTPVQLTNYELREVSTYQVALKASRTSRGVPLLEDVPGLGVLFRPLPNAESSLQENIVMAHSAIFPTLFDLMGLRWAPAVADLDTLRLRNDDFVVRGRQREVSNRAFDSSSSRVDDFIRTPAAERRTDLYRSQETIPDVHPNGYRGPGLNLKDSPLREGYDPEAMNPPTPYVPSSSSSDLGLPAGDVGLPVGPAEALMPEGRPLGGAPIMPEHGGPPHAGVAPPNPPLRGFDRPDAAEPSRRKPPPGGTSRLQNEDLKPAPTSERSPFENDDLKSAPLDERSPFTLDPLPDAAPAPALVPPGSDEGAAQRTPAGGVPTNWRRPPVAPARAASDARPSPAATRAATTPPARSPASAPRPASIPPSAAPRTSSIPRPTTIVDPAVRQASAATLAPANSAGDASPGPRKSLLSRLRGR
ncbi:hypothetical protein [Planctomyces sp. SH-PL62]|uniref:hypothetical protein n=1 Tax=Planctomyces sp. SH-PL62 TaxID=1636152 RepID=UPI000838C684|nr:hypothetical protein [Planctomyces sp. SH-PL62]